MKKENELKVKQSLAELAQMKFIVDSLQKKYPDYQELYLLSVKCKRVRDSLLQILDSIPDKKLIG